jgi:hypothetical protein
LNVNPADSALDRFLKQLDDSRLAKEDYFCRPPRAETEGHWLRKNRTETAAHWNLLTVLKPEHLQYAR